MIVAIAGSTGLTGKMTLDLLLKTKEITQVISIGRRSVEIQHEKLKEVFLKDGKLPEPVRAEAFICCLGTTIKKAGSQEKFLDVDLRLPIHLAESLRERGCFRAAVVSAIGADSKSGVFYNRTKGEMEEQMKQQDFDSLTLLQPSVIDGPRKEFRLGERIGISVMGAVAPLLPGAWKKYKPTPAHLIAEHLVQAVIEGKPGVHVYTPGFEEEKV